MKKNIENCYTKYRQSQFKLRIEIVEPSLDSDEKKNRKPRKYTANMPFTIYGSYDFMSSGVDAAKFAIARIWYELTENNRLERFSFVKEEKKNES